ncbi:hypothetical protein EsHS_00003266 [Epichloe bromicola]
MIEDILNGRYRVVDKLGYGGYSTVWLAHDGCMKRYIAIKVCIANSQPREIGILRALATQPPSSSRHLGQNLVPVPLDEFELRGPNGRHSCYTMTPAMCNLRDISFSRLFPINVARALAYKLALAVSYVHSRGYVHGDIHLRNVLVKPPATFDELSVEQLREEYGDPETVPVMRRDGKRLPPGVPSEAVVPLCMGKDAKEFVLSDARVLLSDFGESFAPDLDPRLGQDCKTPVAMRPPEAFFEPGLPLSYSADIWSLATAIWEIIGMKALFSSEFVGIDEVASQQIDVLGLIPSSWFERWEARTRFFDEDGRPKKARYVWPRLDDAFEECVQRYRRKLDAGEFSKEETAALLDLMRRMLSYRPEERPTTEEVLKSEWMAGPPSVPGYWLPFLGHSPQFLLNKDGFLAGLRKRHLEGMFSLKMMGKKHHITHEPALSSALMNRPRTSYEEGRIAIRMLTASFGLGKQDQTTCTKLAHETPDLFKHMLSEPGLSNLVDAMLWLTRSRLALSCSALAACLWKLERLAMSHSRGQ